MRRPCCATLIHQIDRSLARASLLATEPAASELAHWLLLIVVHGLCLVGTAQVPAALNVASQQATTNDDDPALVRAARLRVGAPQSAAPRRRRC